MQVVFIAHNGDAFDIPFLLRALDWNDLSQLWQENNSVGSTLDTLKIARAVFSASNEDAKPTNNKLAMLYQFFTGSEMEGNHCALDDAKALYASFQRWHDMGSNFMW